MTPEEILSYAPRVLTQTQREQYFQDGFVSIENQAPPTVPQLLYLYRCQTLYPSPGPFFPQLSSRSGAAGQVGPARSPTMPNSTGLVGRLYFNFCRSSR